MTRYIVRVFLCLMRPGVKGNRLFFLNLSENSPHSDEMPGICPTNSAPICVARLTISAGARSRVRRSSPHKDRTLFMVSIVIAIYSLMILAPLRRIERRLFPDANHNASGTGDALCSGDRESHARSVLQPSCPVDSRSDTVGSSGTEARTEACSFESDADTEGCNSVALPGAQILWHESPARRRLQGPNSLRLLESCVAVGTEYQEVFGASGAIHRCKEQFINSRFSPRRALRSGRIDRRCFAAEGSILTPTDVCAIAASCTSHAA